LHVTVSCKLANHE